MLHIMLYFVYMIKYIKNDKNIKKIVAKNRKRFIMGIAGYI